MGQFCTGFTQTDACICTGTTTLYSTQPFYTLNQQVFTQPIFNPSYWAPFDLYMSSGGTSYQYQYTMFAPGLVELGACPTPTPTITPTNTITPTITNTPTPTETLIGQTCHLMTENSENIMTENNNFIDVENCSEPLPTPTTTVTSTLTPTITPTPEITQTPTNTITPTSSITPSPTSEPTNTPTQTLTPTPTQTTEPPGHKLLAESGENIQTEVPQDIEIQH
jgi:hypothetical protein